MNNLLKHFREFKDKLRRRLIHKLGGFSIMPPSDNHIIVQSTTVAPTEFVCKVLFTQEDMYDITPADLEKAAKRKLRSKIADSISDSNMVDFTTRQDEGTGAIEMRASVWLVDPRAMRKAKG